jgi:CheY-like chemotaxis protein
MQGRLGLDLVASSRPGLILLDLHLPDMSGEEVLRRLQAEADTKDIPTVVVSADASLGQIRRVLELGASGYLTKPFDVEELLRWLDDPEGMKVGPA